MGKAKKDIRIIKRDSNKEDYTFVSDNILKNVDNIKNNPSGTTTNEKIENRSRERNEKKILTKKVDNKGRKILGKSLQGHSPIYE
ncbi:MAG TPA: hypothetical protein VF084_12035 [Nitrososphaeraceae archaeon]|jgi:hypothetical protein